jgi:flavin reductase (DIM6/NTAB) family NADH-FMN oxidoreductase RutF
LEGYLGSPTRDWIYLLHPRPAYAICSYANGVYDCLAASWVTPVSREPPILMVSLAPRRETYRILRSSGRATVSVLPWEELEVLHYLGTVSLAKDPGKMSNPKVKVVIRDGYVWLGGALAVIFCKLRTSVEMGDHDAVFLDVVGVEFGECFSPRPRVGSCRYILHVGGGEYTTNSGEVVGL